MLELSKRFEGSIIFRKIRRIKMIVYRVWSTGRNYKFNYKRWEGYFLFGIIPLFIKQTHYQA